MARVFKRIEASGCTESRLRGKGRGIEASLIAETVEEFLLRVHHHWQLILMTARCSEGKTSKVIAALLVRHEGVAALIVHAAELIAIQHIQSIVAIVVLVVFGPELIFMLDVRT